MTAKRLLPVSVIIFIASALLPAALRPTAAVAAGGHGGGGGGGGHGGGAAASGAGMAASAVTAAECTTALAIPAAAHYASGNGSYFAHELMRTMPIPAIRIGPQQQQLEPQQQLEQ